MPHPHQVATPLARILFSFLDPRMAKLYLSTSKFRFVRNWVWGSGPSKDLKDGFQDGGERGKDAQRRKNAQSMFLQVLPPLPDYLTSKWILSVFRFAGDEDLDALEAEDEYDEEVKEEGKGTKHDGGNGVAAFAWCFRKEIAGIVGMALVWVAALFISPLSMNFVSQRL